jgi:Fic/DOC family
MKGKSSLNVQMYSAVIFDAVKEKYGATGLSDVVAVVTQCLQKLESSGATKSSLNPTTDFPSDVANQTRCLWKIAHVWSTDNFPEDILEQIHAVAYGVELNSANLRTTSQVADFTGELMVSPTDIPHQLAILNRFICASVGTVDKTLKQKCEFLAELNGRTIGLHPFQDGNGRVARFTTLLCLSRWSLPWFPTPKVRNDPDWKQALDKAVKGDYGALAQQYEMRITKQLESPL